MRPRNIGRVLGIGVRVAGRIAGQRLAGPSQPRTVSVQARPGGGGSGAAVQERSARQAAGQVAGRAGRGIREGLGGFLRPFRRVGGIVWLEVTGSFFLLFATIFVLRLWQNWTGIGELPRSLAIAAAAVFLYLGISAFWRARWR